MAAPTVEANYEILQTISSTFLQRFEALKATYEDINSKMDTLLQGWEGKAADAFHNEMTGQVLPKFQRLLTAIEQSGDTTRRIKETVEEAEERAGSLFR